MEYTVYRIARSVGNARFGSPAFLMNLVYLQYGDADEREEPYWVVNPEMAYAFEQEPDAMWERRRYCVENDTDDLYVVVQTVKTEIKK